MKLYKFSELSEKAKTKAVNEYIEEEIEAHDNDEREPTSFSDAWSILKIDLEDDHYYTKAGKFVTNEIEEY